MESNSRNEESNKEVFKSPEKRAPLDRTSPLYRSEMELLYQNAKIEHGVAIIVIGAKRYIVLVKNGHILRGITKKKSQSSDIYSSNQVDYTDYEAIVMRDIEDGNGDIHGY